VTYYITRFSGLIDQLLAYETPHDPLYFTFRFVDGLREDIRASVLIQRPSDLDTACVLAQLQEEVLEPVKRREFRKRDYYSLAKLPPKGPLPLPRIDKGGPSTVQMDRRVPDVGRPRPFDERLAALRSYRRARGLCEKCAEKWSRDHRCAEQV
jgi:hypothetical protein